MNSAAYYTSFIQTTARIRRDRALRAKPKCKPGNKLCGKRCVPPTSQCYNGREVTIEQDLSRAALVTLGAAAIIGGVSQGVRSGGEDSKKKAFVKALNKQDQDLNILKKKYQNTKDDDTETKQKAKQEFDEVTNNFNKQAKTNLNPDFESYWNMYIKPKTKK
jgi:hypothetical protein